MKVINWHDVLLFYPFHFFSKYDFVTCNLLSKIMIDERKVEVMHRNMNVHMYEWNICFFFCDTQLTNVTQISIGKSTSTEFFRWWNLAKPEFSSPKHAPISLYILDKSGKKLWNFQIKKNMHEIPSKHSELILVCASNLTSNENNSHTNVLTIIHGFGCSTRKFAILRFLLLLCFDFLFRYS